MCVIVVGGGGEGRYTHLYTHIRISHPPHLMLLPWAPTLEGRRAVVGGIPQQVVGDGEGEVAAFVVVEEAGDGGLRVGGLVCKEVGDSFLFPKKTKNRK